MPSYNAVYIVLSIKGMAACCEASIVDFLRLMILHSINNVHKILSGYLNIMLPACTN